MYYDKLSDLGIKCNNTGSKQKVFCPQCHDGRKNKRDKSLSVNVLTGEYNCHNDSCDFKGNVRSVDKKFTKRVYEKPSKEFLKEISVKEKTVEYFKTRGISENTLNAFMIFSRDEWMPQTGKKENCICFPYMKDSQLVNIKFRDARKNFKLVANAELILYNISMLKGKKYAIIHEGEVDCMSAYEAGFGKQNIDKDTGELLNPEMAKWIPLSVPNGASIGSLSLDYLENCFDEMIDVHEFIIATDNDEAGKKLKDELIRRLGVEKCRVVNYPSQKIVPTKEGLRQVKDINEVLIYFGVDKVQEVLLNSQQIPIDGIYSVSDIFESMLENFRTGVQLAPTTHIDVMDTYFRWKKGDITLLTGYSNFGKTYFMLQIMLIKSIYSGWKWAIYSPENYPANDFYDDIVEMFVGKWISHMTESEYIWACKFIDDHFFYIHPTDEQTIDIIHEKFRYLILKKGVDGVVVDPYNQIDHNQKAYQREDQYLSEILKKIKRFALLNNVVYGIIAHPKNPTPNSDRSLPVPDQYSLNGGAMFGNKTDCVMVYHRPNHHIDKTSKEVEIYTQKIKRKRTGGETGNFSLLLNWSKKRFSNPLTGEMWCDPLKSDYVTEKYPMDRCIAEMKQHAGIEIATTENDFVSYNAETDDCPF